MTARSHHLRSFAIFSDWLAALNINEVRVAQSVALVGQMPVVIFINAVGILIFISAVSAAQPLWMRAAAVGMILLLLVPIVFSWCRLRQRAIPATVSRRRILAITQHSTLLGIAWSGLLLYFVPGESTALLAVTVAGMGFLCVGGAATLAIIPLACIAFSLPLLLTCTYLTVMSSLPDKLPLLEVLALLAFGVVWVANRGWGPMREIILLQSQNAHLVDNLKHQVTRFKALAELSSDWYWEQDDQFRFADNVSNDRLKLIELRHAFAGKTRWEYAPDNDPAIWRCHMDDLNARRKFTDLEYRVRTEDGTYVWLSISGEPRFDSLGKFIGYHGVGKNITERKTAEAEIRQLAYFDPLTALPNRRYLMDRLVEIQASCQRSGSFAAILMLDLDHFKNVNDARGHAVGDELLKTIAQRLRATLRTEEIGARLGGDEFVVLGSNLGGDEARAAISAIAIGDRIRAAILKPVSIKGDTYSLSCSIGVALFPKVDQDIDDLLREADTAMYRAKANGRDRTIIFDASMHTIIHERMALVTELAMAEKHNELQLHFQPQIDHTGSAVGGEMLLRWTHPRHGSVSPAVFIPVAEESGLIIALGEWVLRSACKTSVDFARAGFTFPMSINVSPKQFNHDNFVQCVRQTLLETGADPRRLIFEVTENLLIADFAVTVARMEELATLGIRFSIDDFGTGYSSMAYLRQLPLYELKIDRTFIQGLPLDTSSVAIVSAMLAMAKHLGLRVVAEGVETREQADFLNAENCDCSQGFLFCRPVAAERWLEQAVATTH